MASYLNLRISAAVGKRVKEHAREMGWTPNHFAEHAAEILCDMIEDKAKRVLPKIIGQLDGGKKIVDYPETLHAEKDAAPVKAARKGKDEEKKGAA